MANNRVLSVPTIIVNNKTRSIVPGSFKYDEGEGEITVKAASTGGGRTTSVHAQNAETMLGKCMWDEYLTTNLDSDIKIFKEAVGDNSIQVIQRGASGEAVTKSWSNMSLAPGVEREASADGVTSLEFEGDQAI
jgi:hypothetical protein